MDNINQSHIDFVKEKYPLNKIEVIENKDEHNGPNNQNKNILICGEEKIIAVFSINGDKINQLDLSDNMLGLINNIRRKNLCVL